MLAPRDFGIQNFKWCMRPENRRLDRNRHCEEPGKLWNRSAGKCIGGVFRDIFFFFFLRDTKREMFDHKNLTRSTITSKYIPLLKLLHRNNRLNCKSEEFRLSNQNVRLPLYTMCHYSSVNDTEGSFVPFSYYTGFDAVLSE